jgi:hypothetical protein
MKVNSTIRACQKAIIIGGICFIEWIRPAGVTAPAWGDRGFAPKPSLRIARHARLSPGIS